MSESKKLEDRKKLDEALAILDSVNLGLSWVWMFTWGTIKHYMQDSEWKFNVNEDELWDALVDAVKNNYGFSLEYGAEQHNEQVRDWLLENNFMVDIDHQDEEQE